MLFIPLQDIELEADKALAALNFLSTFFTLLLLSTVCIVFTILN